MSLTKYSLRQIVDVTGITEFTLRGWELRYGAFAPVRTKTGRRRYNSKDLQKAILLRELVKRNHKISNIAGFKLSQLKKMMGSESELMPSSAPINKTEIQEVMKNLSLQDWGQLEVQLAAVFKRLRPLESILEFFMPLLEHIGYEVASGRLSIAQEHILSAMLKQNLNRLIQSRHQSSKFKIVVASPEGDFHELGILASHAIANQLKLCSIFIGPNTPKDQLCETASRFGATHILLGSTVSKNEGAKDDFYSFIHFLDKNLSKNIAFWLGGRACQPIALKREVLQLKSLVDLEQQLSKLKKTRIGND